MYYKLLVSEVYFLLPTKILKIKKIINNKKSRKEKLYIMEDNKKW